jgi:O-antigen ligase
MINYNKNEIKVLRKAFIYSGWIAAILLLYAGAGYAPGRLAITLAGAAEDPNYSVGYMMFILLYSLEQHLRNKKLSYLGLFALFIGLVFLTGSRGGLLAVLGASLFLLVLWMKEQKLKLSAMSRIVLVVGIIALIIYFIFANLPLELRNRFILSAELLEAGGSGRIIIWTSIIESFSVAPLINQLFGMGAATVSFFSHNWAVGHNIWLDSLIETGIIGTVILFAFYFSFLKKAYDLMEHVVASALFGYMLMALTMSLYSYRPIWNILLFILILNNSTRIPKVENQIVY